MQLIRAIIFTFLVMAGSLVMAQPNSPDQPVGKVLFSTGNAYADQLKLQAGSPVYVGQTLSTGGAGHLHIRMIDGAFLSLRADSSAKVSLYTVDLENPANTQIRIDVNHGVVRSVTGKGGEGNHSAFRLNTPVAAIGIRGTDFIVYTDAVSSVVDLRQGAIEMTPLSDTCSPYTLGICGDGQSVTLLDRDPGLLAEVNAARQKATRVSKASAVVVPDKVEPAHPTEDQSLKQAKDTPVVISAAPVAPAAEVKAPAAASGTGSTQAKDASTGTATADTKTATTTGGGTTKTASTTATTPASPTASDSKSVAAPVATAANATSTSESKAAGSTTAATQAASGAVTTVKTSTGTVTFATPSSAASLGSASNVVAASAGATVDVASIAPVTAEVGAKESVTSELASRVITQLTTEDSIKTVEKEVSALPQLPAVTPPVVTAPVAAKAQPFYWGRWTAYAENAEQNIVRDPARNKQVFTANAVMLLASTESGNPRLPKTGVVNFKQDKAEAHVLNGGALHDAEVSNSALAVNFDQNQFTTSLDVSSSALARGTEHLRANGTLDPGTGALKSSLAGSNMTVTGKVADEASHAATLFNQDATGIVGAVGWTAP